MNKITRFKKIKLIILLLGIVYIGYAGPESYAWATFKTKFIDVTKNLDIREGDFVFQHLPVKLTEVIADITQSPYSHCGIIVKKNGRYFVLEAIGPVKETPLNEWIHQGVKSRVTIVRLNEALRGEIPKTIKEAYKFIDRPYDIQYEWDDQKIYCSELIYKAVFDATGIKLAEFKTLGEMKWQPHEQFIRELEGGSLPLERKMITPEDLVRSDKVNLIYSTFPSEKLRY